MSLQRDAWRCAVLGLCAAAAVEKGVTATGSMFWRGILSDVCQVWPWRGLGDTPFRIGLLDEAPWCPLLADTQP